MRKGLAILTLALSMCAAVPFALEARAQVSPGAPGASEDFVQIELTESMVKQYIAARAEIDDVLGVWPLHGLCGAWGGIACGIFGTRALGGVGGVNFWAQLIGTAGGVAWALLTGALVYGSIKKLTPLRLTLEQEYEGADLSIHRIGATPEREVNW